MEDEEEEDVCEKYKLTDFKKLATLGVGGFGRVDLVSVNLSQSTEVKSVIY